MSEDIFSGFNADWDDAESAVGIVGGDLLPKQWALVTVEDVKPEKGKDSGSLGVNLTLRLDGVYALTPNRRLSFIRKYASIKPKDKKDGSGKHYPGWAIFNNLTSALGFGGVPGTENDPPTMVKAEMVTKAVVSGGKGKKVIVPIVIEVDKQGMNPDRNGIDAFYKVTDENLAAIKDAGFDINGIDVKERKNAAGKTERYLVARKKGAKKADAGTSSSQIG